MKHNRFLEVSSVCGLLLSFSLFPEALYAEMMSSTNYTIDGQNVGTMSQSVLSSPNYTLEPGHNLDEGGSPVPSGNSGNQTGSRIRTNPSDEIFISEVLETASSRQPSQIPLLGAEPREGVILEETSVGEEREMMPPSIDSKESQEGEVSENERGRGLKLEASAIQASLKDIFAERWARAAFAFFILGIILYVRVRTGWGRQYLSF